MRNATAIHQLPHSSRKPGSPRRSPAGNPINRVNPAVGDAPLGEALPPVGDTPLADALPRPKRRHYKARARRCKCGCGVRFTPSPTHPRQAFASKACAQRARRARRRSAQPQRQRRANGVTTLLCECCGEWYVGTANVGRRYCGLRCKRLAARLRRAEAAGRLACALGLTLEAATDRIEVHGLRAARLALITLGYAETTPFRAGSLPPETAGNRHI